MRAFLVVPLLVVTLALLHGCGSRPGQDDATCDLLDPNCPGDLVCDAVQAGEAMCVAPLIIRGTVVDATDDQPIAGALVQAVDVNGAAVGSSSETGEDGSYELLVPAVRNVDGQPVEGSYTLRAQALAYQKFPTAIRPALPLDASTAAWDETRWVLESALTTIKLLPLPGDVSTLGSISGVVLAERHAGILVVAEGLEDGITSFTDAEGKYTIFNVPAGTYTVSGYAAGVQLDLVVATLTDGEALEGVDLSESDLPLSTVSGNVQIVNAPGDAQTSIILAVESTFVEDAARGEAPPGLRVGNVTGDFTITEVPDGRYVVLAAFENDGLVRDPDQTIGGTKIVRIEVPDSVAGNDVVLPEGFKVTGALNVEAPGADGPEPIATPTPNLQWQDDSSEDGYEIRVFDAFGNEIWFDEIGPVSGSAVVEHVYAGPPLEEGMFYQFRATSFRERTAPRTAISSTEDLKGVFQYEPAP